MSTFSNPTHTTCGFMVGGNEVALIRKNRPEWQAGLLNGIGGKVEEGETPEEAQVREFQEEAGVRTSPGVWWCFCHLRENVYSSDPVVVWFYLTWGLDHYREEIETMTDEEVGIYPIDDVLVREDVVDSVRWMLQMGLQGYSAQASNVATSELQPVNSESLHEHR